MCPVSSLDLEGQNQVAQHTPTEEAHGSLKSRDILYLQAPAPSRASWLLGAQTMAALFFSKEP